MAKKRSVTLWAHGAPGRDISFKVRCTLAELAHLNRIARRQRMSVGELIRSMCSTYVEDYAIAPKGLDENVDNKEV